MSNKKYNFQHHNYTKKGYLSFQTKMVDTLLNEGKFNLAKNMLKEILSQYPNDRIALTQWAQILIFERKYLEAKDILESLPKDKCYSMLVCLYEKLNEWDKLKELYARFYLKEDKDNCYKYGYRQQRIYLSSIFDNTCPFDELGYLDKQMFNYSDEEAIEHICKSHGGSNKNKSAFMNDFDIEKIFYKVKDFISKNHDRGIINNSLLESFMFYYVGCGYKVDSGLYDTFLVNTIINTDKIITMYPQSVSNANYDVCRLDDLEEKKLVKVKSGIERFNARYNNIQNKKND